jgi:hypothetical protein
MKEVKKLFKSLENNRTFQKIKQNDSYEREFEKEYFNKLMLMALKGLYVKYTMGEITDIKYSPKFYDITFNAKTKHIIILILGLTLKDIIEDIYENYEYSLDTVEGASQLEQSTANDLFVLIEIAKKLDKQVSRIKPTNYGQENAYEQNITQLKELRYKTVVNAINNMLQIFTNNYNTSNVTAQYIVRYLY